MKRGTQKIKRLSGFLGLILLSKIDLNSLYKHEKQWFHMNVTVYKSLRQGVSKVQEAKLKTSKKVFFTKMETLFVLLKHAQKILDV